MIASNIYWALDMERAWYYRYYTQSLFFFFVFLGPHPWHTEVPRLGVELELQLPAYTTITAM